jgi:hypothetical protein
VGFFLPVGGRQGLQLPVPVGGVYHVAVHQGQLAYARPRQKLHSKTPDAPQSHDQNMGFLQTEKGFVAHQKGRTF